MINCFAQAHDMNVKSMVEDCAFYFIVPRKLVPISFHRHTEFPVS